MPPDFILGIDPGLNGAICLLHVSTKKVEVFDMPVTDGRVDAAKLAGIVEMCKVRGSIATAIEQVGSRPHQAKAFAFGAGFGIILGVLGVLGVPVSMVQPAVWKGASGLRRGVNESQAENKTRARDLATRLWPEHEAEFAKVKFDGRAEACLIARFFCAKNGWV
jgi:crossover junction endodeoxyribonuclease RuvC